jgi:hypothetical protein
MYFIVVYVIFSNRVFVENEKGNNFSQRSLQFQYLLVNYNQQLITTGN